MSDAQCPRLYVAEAQLESSWWFNHPDRPPLDDPVPWNELVAFTRMLYADALARPYRHQARVERTRRRLTIERIDGPTSYAEPWCDRIRFTEAQCTTWVAVHEVAHLLADRRGEGAHGWRFAHVLRQMAARHVHPDIDGMLHDIYAWQGVHDLPYGRRARPAVPYDWPTGAGQDAILAMHHERAMARLRARGIDPVAALAATEAALAAGAA